MARVVGTRSNRLSPHPDRHLHITIQDPRGSVCWMWRRKEDLVSESKRNQLREMADDDDVQPKLSREDTDNIIEGLTKRLAEASDVNPSDSTSTGNYPSPTTRFRVSVLLCFTAMHVSPLTCTGTSRPPRALSALLPLATLYHCRSPLHRCDTGHPPWQKPYQSPNLRKLL